MAKQKLYGNHSEPCCETCALGKCTSDGKTVLCRRAGAVPLYHHCRHFVYDPLRRTPHRDRPLESPDPAAFSLEEEILSETEPLAQKDDDSRAILERLRSYLNDTDTPDVATILALLNEEPVSDPVEEDTPREMTEEDQQVLDEIEETLAEADAEAEAEAEADGIAPVFDNTTDIFEDLENFDLDAFSSTRAAFQTPDFELPDLDDTEEPINDPRFLDLANQLDATLTMQVDGDEDDDIILNPEDLILMSAASLRDDPDSEEELVLNPDGSITAKKKS